MFTRVGLPVWVGLPVRNQTIRWVRLVSLGKVQGLRIDFPSLGSPLEPETLSLFLVCVLSSCLLP